MLGQPGHSAMNILGVDLETDGLSPTTGRKFHFQTSFKFFFPDSLYSKNVLFCKQSREGLPAEAHPQGPGISLPALKSGVKLEAQANRMMVRWSVETQSVWEEWCCFSGKAVVLQLFATILTPIYYLGPLTFTLEIFFSSMR